MCIHLKAFHTSRSLAGSKVKQAHPFSRDVSLLKVRHSLGCYFSWIQPRPVDVASSAVASVQCAAQEVGAAAVATVTPSASVHNASRCLSNVTSHGRIECIACRWHRHKANNRYGCHRWKIRILAVIMLSHCNMMP